MANLFLSYDRDDEARARPIATLLERTGHSVWWDRQIKGGLEFGAEIEAALNAAEKIIVLWSQHSIKSAWVRDEAAVGRDTGRLVPITIDGAVPPLGFRQFQTIDLTHWKGRSSSKQLQELLEALGPAMVSTSSPDSIARAKPAGRERPRWLIPVFSILLIMLVGSGWWWTYRGVTHTPVVAIDAANGSEKSQQAARDLAVRLGEMQPASNDAFQLLSSSGDADLVLQVDAQDGATTSRRDLSILSGRTRSILWSTSLQQPSGKVDDLSKQLALTSQRALSCALDALSDQGDRIDPPTLGQYLGGCLRLEGLYGNAQYNPELIAAFEQVVAKAPHFVSGWRKLLSAESEIVISPDPPPSLVLNLRRHLTRAESLGFQIGEIDLAKAALLPPSDFLGRFGLYDRAVKADPNNPLVYRIRSERLLAVGRMMDSVGDARQALQLDPLSPAVQDNYISSLAYAGQIEAAYAQLRKSETMWPAARNIHFARYRLDLRFGDPKEALAIYENEMAGATSMGQVLFLKARMDPTRANVQRAIDAVRTVYLQDPRDIQGLMQTLGQFGRKDEAIDELLHYRRPDAVGYNSETFFRPAMREIWRDPRSIAAAAHAGLLRYWVKSSKWPDFCSDPTLPYNCETEAAKYRA